MCEHALLLRYLAVKSSPLAGNWPAQQKNPSKFKLNKTAPGGRIHPGSNQKFKFESGFFVFLGEKSGERKSDRGCSTLVLHT